MTERSYRLMFLVGALWNLSGAAVTWLGAPWVFGSAHMAMPEPIAFYHAWIALFATYGCGVYMVSRDPYGNLNLIALGIIGKVSFALIFIYYYLSGSSPIPPFFWLAVVGDLIFAALFGAFLNHARARRR